MRIMKQLQTSYQDPEPLKPRSFSVEPIKLARGIDPKACSQSLILSGDQKDKSQESIAGLRAQQKDLKHITT